MRKAAFADIGYLRHLPLRAPGRCIFVHAPRDHFSAIENGEIDFFNGFEAITRRFHLKLRLVRSTPRSREIARSSSNLHILMGDKPAPGPNVLHACPTYLQGFWYLEPAGVRAESGYATRGFNPEQIDDGAAYRFVKSLRQRSVDQNRSKYEQPARASARLRKGCVAFFAQEIEPGSPNQTYVALEPLLRELIHLCAGRDLYIKPHPRQSPEHRAMLQSLHDPDVGVHVVDVSLHDLLEACDFVVVQTSAVAFEAFLHGKPSIVTGKTDFCHNVLTVRHINELKEAMYRVDHTPFRPNKYLYWFLHLQSLEPAAPDFLDRLEARIRATGWRLD